MKILVTNSWIARHVEEIRGDFPAVEFVIEDGDAEKIAAAADAEVAFGNRSGVADRLIEHRGRIADIVQARGDPDEAQRIREAAAGTTQATRE